MKEKSDSKITYRDAIPEFLKSLSFVWKFDKGFVVCSIFIYLLTSIPTILATFSVARFNEIIISGESRTYISATFPLLLYAAINIIDYIAFSCYFWLQEKVVTRFTNILLQKSSRKARLLKYSNFDDPELYDIVFNGWSQDGNTYILSLQNVLSSISHCFAFFSYFSVLSWLDWRLLFLLLLVAFFYSPLSDLDWKLRFKYQKKYAETRRKENYYYNFFSDKTHVTEGRVFGLYEFFEKKYLEEHRINHRAEFHHQFIEKAIDLLGIFVSKLPSTIVYIWLSIRVFEGSLELSNMILYTTMFSGFLNIVYNTFGNLSNIKQYSRITKNVNDFLALPSYDDHQMQVIPTQRKHWVEFRKVSFKYPNSEKYILNNISFSTFPNEIVTIIGENGAGKSTLIHLLMRFYEPTEGRIFLDGVDIRCYPVLELYSMFGVLFQEYCVYPNSFRESITLDANQTIMPKFYNALRMSTAEVILRKIPFGIETFISRTFHAEGIELSGGEKQRVALARAYYKDAEILVLDEPSASIDPINEAEIFSSIINMKGKKSIFLISHRLSSCAFSDRVLFLKDGKLIGNGKHTELLSSSREYRRLYLTQSQKYIQD